MREITLDELRDMCPPEEERIELGREIRATVYSNGHGYTGFLGYSEEDGLSVQVPSHGIELIGEGSEIEIDNTRYRVVKGEGNQ